MPPPPDRPRDDFPVQQARTRRFSLGIPRSFTLAPDGTHMLFLRSRGPDDPVTDLWHMDLDAGTERRLLVADGGHAAGELGDEERARRERTREMAEGITTYACDRDVTLAATALGGAVITVGVADGDVRREEVAEGVFDPRPSPDGGRIGYVAGDELRLYDRARGEDRVLVGESGIRWGVADFLAAEEMGRSRGFWWAPDGARLLACRVDERPVAEWHLGDPASPATPSRPRRYPAAGTANPETALAILDADTGERTDVSWDSERFPYLARASWRESEPLTLLVQTRSQRRWRILTVDPDTGATRTVREDHAEDWLDLVPGAPAWVGDRLAVVVPTDRGSGGTVSLLLDGEPVTPAGLNVRSVLDATPESVHLVASEDPLERHVYELDVATGDLERLTEEPGVHGATVVAGTAVVTTETMAAAAPRVTVRGGGRDRLTVRTDAAIPAVTPVVELLELGPARLRAALLLPHDVDADPHGALPVLLDPYGGPHAQRVLRAERAFLTSQWFADQGYAVLIVDGRGTPGRGPAWERAVAGDLAGPPLEDQITALEAAAEHEPRLDLDRVAIRGWSFGGFLAALAVLRRPDVFRAGIAGAPVTDWRLYDTHYTERYLGHPDEDPAAYRRSSLVDEDLALLGAAAVPEGEPEPALMLIHGLADDNVVAAHTLRLSAALLAAGRPHRVLPLSGVTHMTPQETVSASLLRLQAAFLRETLAGR